MIFALSFLLFVLLEAQSKQLLLQKQRSRLDNIFSYEIRECIKSACLLSPGVWSIPAQTLGSHGVGLDRRNLPSVRAIIDDIAFATTPQGLVDIVRELDIVQPLLWTIEYECLSQVETSSTAIGEHSFVNEIVGKKCETKAAEINEQSRLTKSSSAADRKSFSSKTLFCAISQFIKGAPALDTRDAAIFYFILETTHGFHFGSAAESLSPLSIIRYPAHSSPSTPVPTPIDPTISGGRSSLDQLGSESLSVPIKEFWAGRPFIFSAALNIEIAESVMNILKTRLKEKSGFKNILIRRDDCKRDGIDNSISIEEHENKDLEEQKIIFEKKEEVEEKIFTVLDPCCGSGTTLFIGRRLGFRAIGSDVNSAFIAGTAANLRYAGYALVQSPDNEISYSVSDTPAVINPVVISGIDRASCDKDLDNIITSNMNMDSDILGIKEDKGGPLLQLFVKDASYASSSWLPYFGEIIDKTSLSNDIISKDKIENRVEIKGKIQRLQGEEFDNIGRMEESLETEQSMTSSTNSLPILTTGRTKRYLQEKKLVRDSSQFLGDDSKGPWGAIDCVFCNFPWGENIFEYFNETENILKVLGSKLNSGCECAFITKQPISKNVLENSGFIIRDIIPIGDDALVKGNKKRQGQSQAREQGLGQGQSQAREQGLGQGQSQAREQVLGQGQGQNRLYSKKNKENNNSYRNEGDNKVNTGDCFVTFASVV